MLTQLSVSNFTLVDRLDIEIQPRMTAITGETGAGKSILLDALGMALGDRSDASKVRAGTERADIHARFDTGRIHAAKTWLKEHQLDNGDECLLRRVVTAEGKSRGYINGHPVTLQQLRTLGEMLIDIHSQHEHQSLLKKDTHRRLLDEYAGSAELAAVVRQRYQTWRETLARFARLRDSAEEVSARQQLLSYQVEELDHLALAEGELETLESEQKTLANAESILHSSHQLASLCGSDEQSLCQGLNRALQLLYNLPEKTSPLNEAEKLLGSALIQVEEARREIEHHISCFELNPERLREVEGRLSAIYDIARKHRVQADELPALHCQLGLELEQLCASDSQLDELEARARAAEADYRHHAEQLTRQRRNASPRLSQGINRQLKALAMPHARVEIALRNAGKPGPQGFEEVEFLITTNPGQAPRPLAKVASGGELSRVSLAIQVVTAKTSTTPTLVFDEVDVGIGGATADRVGQLLRKLGEQGQVICVTHLAQVASKAHQHLQVTKQSSRKSAQSTLVELTGEQKVVEIARMLGGASITDQSRAHAKEMVEAVG